MNDPSATQSQPITYLHPTVEMVIRENAKPVPNLMGDPGSPKPQSFSKLFVSTKTYTCAHTTVASTQTATMIGMVM